jgi:hypothetical protein
MPFFSREADIARRINRCVGNDWHVTLGVNPRTGGKALKAVHNDGRRVLVRFSSETPLGLSIGGAAPIGFCFQQYVDWSRMFNDLADSDRRRDHAPDADRTRSPYPPQQSSVSGTTESETPTAGDEGEDGSPSEEDTEVPTVNVSRTGYKHALLQDTYGSSCTTTP